MTTSSSIQDIVGIKRECDTFNFIVVGRPPMSGISAGTSPLVALRFLPIVALQLRVMNHGARVRGSLLIAISLEALPAPLLRMQAPRRHRWHVCTTVALEDPLGGNATILSCMLGNVLSAPPTQL